MDPTLAVQAAIVAALKADAPLAAMVGTKIYDRVPPTVVPPYCALTGWQEIDQGTECMDASEVFFDVQCFSTAVGRPECAAIAAAVKKALNRVAPAVTAHTNVEIQHNSTLYFTETDNLTSRAVVSFRALVDSAV
jgi:hypothetical protein